MTVDVAFALGGGGVLGAHEVGMLQALFEADIRPDLVVGTSVGAINGAMVAADPSAETIARLEQLWTGIGNSDVFGGSIAAQVSTLVRTRTHLHANTALRRLLHQHLKVTRIEEMAVPFQCVAASIEKAGAHWFSDGPIIEAVLASTAVPGLLPPVEIDGEHFLDGGLVHSIPVGRAVTLGAKTIYVLHVGRIEEPLTPPSSPLQVGLIAFEIARRHRFVEEMRALPDDVTVHVLPSGGPPKADLSQLRYRDFSKVHERIGRAHAATRTYLEEHAT